MDANKAKAMAYTLGLVFAVTFLTQWAASGIDVFHINLTAMESAVNAAISAVVVFIINYANPYVTRYGVGSE